MKRDMRKTQDRDEKDTEEKDASVPDETVKNRETVTPVTATRSQPRKHHRRRKKTTAAPTQQVTPEPTQETAVQEQHKEARVNDAETANRQRLRDTERKSYQHRSDRSFRQIVRIATRFMLVTEEFSSRMIWQIILHPSWYTPSVSSSSLIIHI